MRNKRTFSARPKDVSRSWYIIDAKGKILGRMATQLASILWGKNKATFTPHLDTGDYVVVINAKEVKFSGGKEKTKTYFTHSGYPGGAKTLTLEEMMKRDPRKVIRHAVRGMLPKGRLGNSMINKLRIFADEKHSYVQKEFKTI